MVNFYIIMVLGIILVFDFLCSLGEHCSHVAPLLFKVESAVGDYLWMVPGWTIRRRTIPLASWYADEVSRLLWRSQG